MDPLRGLVVFGVNVTETVQVALMPRLLEQLLVCANSVVVEAILERVSVALPLLVTVKVLTILVVFTVCAPKSRLVGLKEIAGKPVPVPLSGTVCVPVPALSVIVTVPRRVPVAVGVNVTEIEQVPLIAIGLFCVQFCVKA